MNHNGVEPLANAGANDNGCREGNSECRETRACLDLCYETLAKIDAVINKMKRTEERFMAVDGKMEIMHARVQKIGENSRKLYDIMHKASQ